MAWVDRLNALQAIEQCRELGIQPSSTLEENRVALKRYVREMRDKQSATNQASALGTPPVAAANRCFTPRGASARPEQPELIDLVDRGEELRNLAWTQVDELLGPELSPAGTSYRPIQPRIPAATGMEAAQSSACIPEQIIMQMRALNVEAIAQTVQAMAAFNPRYAQQEQNIPSFVRDMVKELPKVDGLNIPATVTFLKGIAKIVNLNLAPVKAVLLHATPQTAGPFREFWVENVAKVDTWAEVVSGFTGSYLTPDALRNAQNQLLYRQQQQSEKIAEYVKDMQLSYQVLAPETASDKVFEAVFCRINPETRNCLTGFGPIKTMEDLLQAAPMAENIRQQFIKQQTSSAVPNPDQPKALQQPHYNRSQNHTRDFRPNMRGSYGRGYNGHKYNNNNYRGAPFNRTRDQAGVSQNTAQQPEHTHGYAYPQAQQSAQHTPAYFPYPPPPLPRPNQTPNPNQNREQPNLNFNARR